MYHENWKLKSLSFMKKFWSFYFLLTPFMLRHSNFLHKLSFYYTLPGINFWILSPKIAFMKLFALEMTFCYIIRNQKKIISIRGVYADFFNWLCMHTHIFFLFIAPLIFAFFIFYAFFRSYQTFPIYTGCSLKRNKKSH